LYPGFSSPFSNTWVRGYPLNERFVIIFIAATPEEFEIVALHRYCEASLVGQCLLCLLMQGCSLLESSRTLKRYQHSRSSLL